VVEHLSLVHRVPVLEDVLDGLVAVLVLGQLLQVGQDALHDRLGHGLVALLQHALDDAAALGVLREHEAVRLECFDDVLHDVLLLAHGLDDLLDHVVAVLVLH